MATRPSPTGPWACRPRRRPTGRWPPFSANAQAGVNTMPTSEVTMPAASSSGGSPTPSATGPTAAVHLRRRASHASRRTRSRAGEQPEAVAQPRCDLLRGERAHPGGGQLERQRHAVHARQIASPGPRSPQPRRTIPLSTQGGQKLDTWAGVAEGTASDQDHFAVAVGSGQDLVLTIARAHFQRMACATGRWPSRVWMIASASVMLHSPASTSPGRCRAAQCAFTMLTRTPRRAGAAASAASDS
jgi:hypothetical protein